jgi:hypothetical protein
MNERLTFSKFRLTVDELYKYKTMSKRLPFTDDNKPEEDIIVLIHAITDEKRKYGAYFIGLVLGYDKDWYGDDVIVLGMFVNDRETDASVKTKNIVWWTPIPLTKDELWSGESTIE